MMSVCYSLFVFPLPSTDFFWAGNGKSKELPVNGGLVANANVCPAFLDSIRRTRERNHKTTLQSIQAKISFSFSFLTETLPFSPAE